MKPKSWATLSLRKFVHVHVGGQLEPLGFRRRSMIWNRRVGDFIQIVEVHRRHLNLRINRVDGAPGPAMFTLHAAVESASVWRALFGESPPPFVSAFVRAGMGERQFGPGGREFWLIEPQSDVDALGVEMARIFTTVTLPWLEERSSLPSFRSYFLKLDGPMRPHDTGPPPALLAVEGLMDNEAAVRELVRESLRRCAARDQRWLNRLPEEWRVRLRLHEAGLIAAKRAPTRIHDPQVHKSQLRSQLDRLGFDPGIVDECDDAFS